VIDDRDPSFIKFMIRRKEVSTLNGLFSVRDTIFQHGHYLDFWRYSVHVGKKFTIKFKMIKTLLKPYMNVMFQ
jgi:hypothetical protein